MKQALKVIDEIKVDYGAIEKTKSQYVINDRLKHIKTLKKDLKDYCKYRGFDYDKLLEDNNL